jgi:hypothetical protein
LILFKFQGYGGGRNHLGSTPLYSVTPEQQEREQTLVLRAPREAYMTRWSIHAWATFGAALAVLIAPAMAEKYGGILRSYSIDSPASLSIHEEVTIYALRPVMGCSTTSSCTTNT